MRRSVTSASDRIEPIDLVDGGKAARKSLSATRHKRDEHPTSAKQPSRARLQPIDRPPSVVERTNDIRAFMTRAARFRRSFDDANG